MIRVFALEPKFRTLRPRILKLTRALKNLLPSERDCAVYLLGGKFMKKSGAELRKMYARAKKLPSHRAPRAFNVLAFPAVADFPEPESQKALGEIYLDVDHIKSRGESLERMLIHGYLHLLGFSHGRKDDRIAMEKKEAKLWQEIFSRR